MAAFSISSLNPVVREFYTVYYDQAFSPNQEDLALVDNFGQLITIPTGGNPTSERRIVKETSNFSSLATLSNGLIAGSVTGRLCFLDWDQLLDNDLEEKLKPKWTISVGQREVNSIAVLNDKQFLIGTGDGGLSLRDAARPDAVLGTFDGHTDQINQVSANSDATFVSCSSDGTVLLFDARNGSEAVRKIDMGSQAGLQKDGFSRSVLAIGLQDQFVIAGGGLSLAKFDLGSGILLQALPSPKSGDNYDIHSIEVSRERIGVGTSTGSVLAYSHAGTLINEIPVGHGAVLNLTSATNDNHRHLLTAVSGISGYVTMLVNYGYISSTLKTF
uniref:WD_REPEATS_REGION domain-containing protein n=1 Tax=Panagrellus redivivus TaxID=6233 RepID=A0A7E4VAS0_PANRE